MANRLAQVTAHITNSFGRGLLVGEVAIITGTSLIGAFQTTLTLLTWDGTEGSGQVRRSVGIE